MPSAVSRTEQQLEQRGVKYHNLIMGFEKDFVVDECSMTPKAFFEALR
jgi:hypothetical protein